MSNEYKPYITVVIDKILLLLLVCRCFNEKQTNMVVSS